MNRLSFAELRQANVLRLPLFKNRLGEQYHTEENGAEWSPAQWLQAVVGEIGEYANLRKKFERGDVGYEEFRAEAANELADVVCYLDILALQFDIDLGKAVTDKFNAVSDRIGVSVRLESQLNFDL